MGEQIRELMATFDLAPELFWPIVGLVAVQLVLQAVALVDLVRRQHVTLGDRKWAWALIIVLGELLGPILYFALGRVKYAPGEERRPLVDRAAAEDKAQQIVDKLYGGKEGRR